MQNRRKLRIGIFLLVVMVLAARLSFSVNAEETEGGEAEIKTEIEAAMETAVETEIKTAVEENLQDNKAPAETQEAKDTEKPAETQEAKDTETPTVQPEELPLPMVLISRDEFKGSLRAGEEKELTFHFQNLSDISLESPVATFTPSEALTIVNGSASFRLENLSGKATASLKVKVKALKTIASANQFLEVRLKFNYNNKIALVQGAAEEKIPIPAKANASDKSKQTEEKPLPMVLISRDDMKEPMRAGEERELVFRFQNLSDSSLENPVVTFTPSEALTIVSGSTSFRLANVSGKSTASLKVRVKALKTIASANQFLETKLKFNYNNGSALVSGTAEEKVAIPALASDGKAQPILLVSHSPVTKSIASEETVDVAVVLKNVGTVKAASAVVSFTPSEGLIIMNETGSFLLGDIEAGAEASAAVRVKAAKGITTSNPFLNVELNYSYHDGSAIVQGTHSDKLYVPAIAESEQSDSPAPNIIIRNFTYGGNPIAAGSSFPLRIDFENTGKMTIENLVVALDGGEHFTVDGVTNTYYYESLAAKGKQTLEVPFQALASAKSGAQGMDIRFKYEYVDKNKRSNATAEIRLSVPISQPNRFRVDAPRVPESVSVQEEVVLSLPYVNKGKGEIFNVEAAIEENDDIDTPAATQYIGNIAAGSSGTIGFVLIPKTAGELKALLKVTYEDSEQKLQTKEFPIRFLAKESEMEAFADSLAEEPSEKKPSFALPVGIAVLLAVAFAGVFLWRRKRQKQEEAVPVSSEWDWDETDIGGDDSAGEV